MAIDVYGMMMKMRDLQAKCLKEMDVASSYQMRKELRYMPMLFKTHPHCISSTCEILFT